MVSTGIAEDCVCAGSPCRSSATFTSGSEDYLLPKDDCRYALLHTHALILYPPQLSS